MQSTFLIALINTIGQNSKKKRNQIVTKIIGISTARGFTGFTAAWH